MTSLILVKKNKPFKSRCNIVLLCRYAIPASTCLVYFNITGSENAPYFSSIAATDPPAIHSVKTEKVVASLVAPSSLTMLGCLSLDIRRISSSIVASTFSCSSPVIREKFTCLTAMIVPVLTSRAWKQVENAPVPKKLPLIQLIPSSYCTVSTCCFKKKR